MSYGDSANWDGEIPAMSYVEYVIEWKMKFKGSPPISCPFEINTEDEIKDVARKLADAWNLLYPYPPGPRAIYTNTNPNRICTIQFDPEVVRMQVRGYKKPPVGTPSPSDPFRHVEYGIKTPVLLDSDGVGKLFVFNG